MSPESKTKERSQAVERMKMLRYTEDEIRLFKTAIRDKDEEAIDTLPCKCRGDIICPPCNINYLRDVYDGFKLKNSGRSK